MIRIVRMHFTPEGEAEFLRVFNASAAAIRQFPGCRAMNLYPDCDQPHTFATVSYWNGPEDLAAYRTSELFQSVWQQVRPLMASKPIAFSLAE